MKLALGSVQFGTDYGVSNTAGRVPNGEAASILARATRAGIDLIDTAPAYGDSEDVLGRLAGGFRIVTKIGPIDPSRGVREQVRASFESSLARLRRGTVYGLLAHRAGDLSGPSGGQVAEAMRELVAERRVEKIGVSVYREDEIAAVFVRGGFDLIQVPVSIVDQRLINSGALVKLKASGVEVHARSAFLQGLLLMDPERLDSRFDSVRAHLLRIRAAIATRRLTPLEAAIGFPAGRPEVDRVVIGVCSVAELEQAIDASRSVERKVAGDWSFAEDFAWSDERIVNPSLWGKH